MNKQKQVYLITRGDDCGLNRSTNEALLDACQKGILKNVSLMANGPAIEEAAKLFAGYDEICFGLHLTFNSEWDQLKWGPIQSREKVPSLVDGNGHFYPTTALLKENHPRLDEAMTEVQSQYDRLRELGFRISYVDEHMQFGLVIEGFTEALDAWCRNEGLFYFRWMDRRLPKHWIGPDRVDNCIETLRVLESGCYTWVGHPAYTNEDMRLLGNGQYPWEEVASDRKWEREMFLNKRIMDYCLEHGIQSIRYDERSKHHL